MLLGVGKHSEVSGDVPLNIVLMIRGDWFKVPARIFLSCNSLQIHMGREMLALVPEEDGLLAGIGSCILLCRKCFVNRDLSLNAAFTSYCVLIISHKRHEMTLIIGSKCHQNILLPAAFSLLH